MALPRAAIQYVVDFMFWIDKKFGWYIEQSYGVGIGSARGERSAGGSAGNLIRLP